VHGFSFLFKVNLLYLLLINISMEGLRWMVDLVINSPILMLWCKD
jgi:hypothetical protein